MKKKITVKRKKKLHRRKPSIFRFRGQASSGILLILLIVFLIFIGSFLIARGTTQPSSGGDLNSPSTFPSLSYETGGGMHPFNITPLPSTYSSSMCNLQTNDIVLVIDNSGSMRGTKLEQAKAAAGFFVELIGVNPESRVGVVVFNKTASLLSPLTSNVDELKNDINKLDEGSNTCIQCGVAMASTQFTQPADASASASVKRSVVLLSDGKANYVDGKKVNTNAAKTSALQAVTTSYSSTNASYYTIAIGEDADESFMSELATSTNGAAFSAASFDILTNTFANVATDICTGT